MAKGRIPRPKVINDLKGDTHKRRRHTVEPTPSNDRPTCPDYLGEVAKTEWLAITEQLDQMGLLSSADASSLEMYCNAYERYRKAHDDLKKFGEYTKTPNGHIQPGPWMSQLRQAEDSCRKWMIEFGLTPAARSRLAVKKEVAADNDIIKFITKKTA